MAKERLPKKIYVEWGGPDYARILLTRETLEDLRGNPGDTLVVGTYRLVKVSTCEMRLVETGAESVPAS